jgi:hypothetical protein
MFLQVFVEVFFIGFALILGILSVMRGLYALGICRRPQRSTDDVGLIALEQVEIAHQTVKAPREAPILSNHGLHQSKHGSAIRSR